MRRRMGTAVALLLVAGCSVRVNKDSGGEDKDVHVSMPFGHVDVHKDPSSSPPALGLPVYPGAKLDAARGKDRAVDVNVGFGPWKVRVQAADYAAPDSEEKVQAFYKHALAEYGAVLTCKGKAPVGEPTRTAEGLTCRDDGKGGSRATSSEGDLELKAGLRNRQHVVAFHGGGGAGNALRAGGAGAAAGGCGREGRRVGAASSKGSRLRGTAGDPLSAEV